MTSPKMNKNNAIFKIKFITKKLKIKNNKIC